jgi:nucleoside-diphosphate-sugar epimerase
MKVLLTGDRGYLGSLMVKHFGERGHVVVGLDTDFYSDCDFTTPPNGYRRLKTDTRDIALQHIEGFDAVVHLAGLSNDPLGSMNPELTYDINHRASANLAHLAKQAGVRRFIFASSCSMYGAAGEEALDEQAPLRPLTPYAESKVRTEDCLGSLADENFCPTFMRNATVYGLSPRLRADIVLNNLVGWAVTIGKIRIMSDGTPWRPIVHAEDIASAFALVLEAPIDLVHNQAFNIGSDGQNYQVKELASIVEKCVKNCTVEYVGPGNPDPRSYRVKFGKFARAFPDFNPRWDAVAGAEQLYDGYRREGLTQEALDGRKYVRLKQLRHLIAQGDLDSNLRWKGGTDR